MTCNNVHGIEDSDGNILSVGAIGDGEYLKRDGNTLTSGVPSGGEGGGSFTSRVFVYLGVNQSIPDQTWTVVNLNTELFDGNNEFDINTHRFTAGASGYYFVSVASSYDAIQAGKVVHAAVRANGNDWKILMNLTTGLQFAQVPSISGVIYLAAGDYIESMVWHNYGASRNINASDYATFMSVHRLS